MRENLGCNVTKIRLAARHEPNRQAAGGFRNARLTRLLLLGCDCSQLLGLQREGAERQAHHALDLIGRCAAPTAHARHDHGFLARHWMMGAAGRQTKTPPLPALPALATASRTRSPPYG